MSEIKNISLDQGSTFLWDITVNDPDAPKQPFNLVGYVSRGMARLDYADAAPAFTFTCTVTDAAEGLVRVELSDELSAGVDAGVYVYDIEIESAGGDVYKLYRGRVTVNAEATK